MIVPLGNKIRIDKDAIKTHTESGMVIPDSALKDVVTGTVISVGDKVLNVKEGDRVAFQRTAGASVDVDGEVVFYIREDEAHFIITK